MSSYLESTFLAEAECTIEGVESIGAARLEADQYFQKLFGGNQYNITYARASEFSRSMNGHHLFTFEFYANARIDKYRRAGDSEPSDLGA